MATLSRKRIVLVNHSDTRGGASVVAYRLMRALCNAGMDARMLVLHKGTADPRVDTVGPHWRARAAFLAECAQIYLHNGRNRSTVFRASTGAFGVPVSRHAWVKDADAVIVNWVNQGMMSLDDIARIGARGTKLAWAMHDMWCATGVCHHAGTCTRFAGTCGDCPVLGGGRKKDLATAVQRHKKRLYAAVPDLKFVAVSNWLADRCRQSSLLARADVHVIANAFPAADFDTVPKTPRHKLGLPPGRLIVMGAARLDDPVKNLPLAVDALNILAGGGEHADAHAVFYGNLRDAGALDGLKMPHTRLGPVAQADIARIYTHATAVLSTSHYETLPGTLIEGMAAGATPVATANGGQPDIIEHGTDGWLAADGTPGQIARFLARSLDAPFDRHTQHTRTAHRFADDNIARQWTGLLFGQ